MKKNLLIVAAIILVLLIALTGFIVIVSKNSPAGIAVGIFGFVAVVCLIPFFVGRK